jgi:hypothetical protein
MTKNAALSEGVIRAELAQAWKELLLCEEVLDADNFFSSGGNSLTAVELLTRFQVMLPRRPSLADLLRCQTFSDQLSLFTNPNYWSVGAGYSSQPGISSGQSVRLGQTRRDILERGRTRLSPVLLLLRLTGQVDIGNLKRSLIDLISRHDALRTSFFDGEGNIRVTVQPPDLDDCLEIADLTSSERKESWNNVWRKIDRAIARGVDFTRSPLGLVLIARISDSEVAVAILMDHLIADARSTEILAEDLAEIYTARADQRPPGLATLPASSQLVLSQVAQDPADTGERIEAWRRILRGYPSPPSFDLLARSQAEYQDTVPGRLTYRRSTTDPASVARLSKSAQSIGIPVFPAIIATVYVAAHFMSGLSDICIVTPYMRRDSNEAQRVVNNFSSVTVIRVTDVFNGKPCTSTLAGIARHVARCTAVSQEHILPLDIVLGKMTEGSAGEAGPDSQRAMLPWLRCNYLILGKKALKMGDCEANVVADGPPPGVDLPNIRAEALPNLDVTIAQSQHGLEVAIVGSERLYGQHQLERFEGIIKTLVRDFDTSRDVPIAALLAAANLTGCNCGAPIT